MNSLHFNLLFAKIASINLLDISKALFLLFAGAEIVNPSSGDQELLPIFCPFSYKTHIVNSTFILLDIKSPYDLKSPEFSP